ncbi:MAG: histidine phosphatase family protein [Chloroflexota bacterium]
MLLYVVRHGQSEMNLPGWETLPSTDAPLTEKGHAQCAALRDWMKARKLHATALYASTLVRTQQTARYLEDALSLKAIDDHRIREISSNDASGAPLPDKYMPRKYSDLKPKTHPFAPRQTTAPNAESWMQFRARLGYFTSMLLDRHQGQIVYVVAHGGVVSGMLENIYNSGPYRTARTHSDNSSWTLFEHQSDSPRAAWVLRHHNRVDHLIEKGLF